MLKKVVRRASFDPGTQVIEGSLKRCLLVGRCDLLGRSATAAFGRGVATAWVE